MALTDTEIKTVASATPAPAAPPATAKPFTGRVALVTGGTRGIGAAITYELAALGAHVAAGYSRDVPTAQGLAQALRDQGYQVSTHQGNIGNPEDCRRVVQEVLDQEGHIDFLVNNAGVTRDRTVRKMTVDDWDAVLRIDLSGTFYMIKAVLDHMLERQYGRIVNISSVIGETGNIGQANYSASKSGLFGLTRSLALETVRKGITVNCVAPGFIATEMVEAIPVEALQKVIERIPMQRLGQPWEVARVVRFLLEDGSAYITGAVYNVNGGLEM